MKNKQAEIYDSLNLLAIVLNQPQDSTRLQFYAEALKDFDSKSVIRQIESFAKSARYFPQLVEIIEPMRGLDMPSDELATIIASEIIECLHLFGNDKDSLSKLREKLGEKYSIIERFGGWNSLSQITYAEIPSTRAQLRELAKAYINRSKREIREDYQEPFRLNTETQMIEEKKNGLKNLSFEIQ